MRLSNRSEGGFVLVVVLWVLAILTVITLTFGRNAMMERRAAMLGIDHSQGMCMARGAVERGIVEVRNKAIVDELWEQAGYTGLNQQLFRTVNLLKDEEYFSLANDPDFKGEVCGYEVFDEESRISINQADEELLSHIEGLDRKTVSDVVQYRKQRARGMKEVDPRSLYGAFTTIEEVQTLFEIEDSQWYGSGGKPGIRDVLTLWGDEKININTASVEVLSCLPDLDPSVAAAIVEYRLGMDGKTGTGDDQTFAAVAQVVAELGLSPDQAAPLLKYCKVDSQFFTITGFATRRQSKVRVSCSATVVSTEGTVALLQWQEGALGS
jgi:DNA uptake protein ComE-like DNA-binding protein